MTQSIDERPQHETWNRWEKVDFLLETCGDEFKAGLVDKIVSSMTDREFDETYQYICRTEGLARDYEELEQINNDGVVLEPEHIAGPLR